MATKHHIVRCSVWLSCLPPSCLILPIARQEYRRVFWHFGRRQGAISFFPYSHIAGLTVMPSSFFNLWRPKHRMAIYWSLAAPRGLKKMIRSDGWESNSLTCFFFSSANQSKATKSVQISKHRRGAASVENVQSTGFLRGFPARRVKSTEHCRLWKHHFHFEQFLSSLVTFLSWCRRILSAWFWSLS